MKKLLILSILSLLLFSSAYANFELTQARSFMQKKDYSKALFYYEQAVAINPTTQDIYIEYIYCLRASGLLNQAVKQSYIALDLNENNPELWLLLSGIYSDMHEWNASLNAISKADSLVTKKDVIVANYLNLAYRSIVAGENKFGYEPFERAFAIDPNNPLGYINKGILEYINDNKSSAEELVEKGIQLAEKDTIAKFKEWGYTIQTSMKQKNFHEFINSIQFDQYQLLDPNLKSRPEKGKAASLQISSASKKHYNIFNQSKLVVTTPTDYISKIVLNNESGSIDLRFQPIFGKDNFDFWISQYPGEISSDNFKIKSESLLNALIKKSMEPEAKIQTITDDNVTISYVSVANADFIPNSADSFPLITQGMAKYPNGFVVFSILTYDKNGINSKMDIIRNLQINKK